jgi:hypothetical protein
MSNEHEEFESPPEVQEAMPEEFEEEAIEVPPEGEESGEEASVEYAPESPYNEFPQSLLEIKSEVTSQLAQMNADSDTQSLDAESVTEGANNIVGVGLGTAEDDFSLGVAPGTPALNVYVAEAISVEEVKSLLVESMGVSSASSDDIPINVIVTGVIEAQNHRRKYRPTPCGVSVGHYKITAGTIGCLALRRVLVNGQPRYRILVLSNNHVLANSNNAKFGDSIIQPGRYDGGVSTRDRIAILERFVPIDFSGRRCNYVDCATGWCWSDKVRREELYESGGKNYLYRINSSITHCQRGQIVGKSGRTTGLTRGYITDCSASVRVNYGNGRVALFCDQIVIRGIGGNFSAGGDSGSVIWTWNSSRNPVGLLFAGGGGYTIANKMTRVLPALQGISLYT